MRANLAALCLSIFAGATALSAQTAPQSDAAGKSVDYSYVYCSGFTSDPKIPDDIRVVSGEQSDYKIAWDNGEYIYINRGTDKGVKVGDRFVIARPEHDIANEWFYGQKKLEKGMGTLYTDAVSSGQSAGGPRAGRSACARGSAATGSQSTGRRAALCALDV